MKNLSNYLPAQTLLLLEDKNASIKELLKITFMDLLLKQVIQTKIIPKQANNRDKVRYYKYITIGKNFYKYQSLTHENVYLSPFHKSNTIQILFSHLVRIGFQNVKNESKFIWSITQSTALNAFFSQHIFQTLFDGFSITPEGLALRNTLKLEILELEKEIPEIIHADKEKALHILKTIGGNIFLLKNIDFTLLQQIDSEILAEINKKNKDREGDSGCYGCSSWDSGCSGCSGGGGSGCSGCSGCGGCS